jgi:hypothetical protein
LESKDSGHETASGPRGSEFGGDDGTQWVITANTDAQYEPPGDDSTKNTDSSGFAANRLAKRGHNDNHEFDAI